MPVLTITLLVDYRVEGMKNQDAGSNSDLMSMCFSAGLPAAGIFSVHFLSIFLSLVNGVLVVFGVDQLGTDRLQRGWVVAADDLNHRVALRHFIGEAGVTHLLLLQLVHEMLAFVHEFQLLLRRLFR